MSEFIPGVELARAFYEEAVRPLIREIPHSAGLLGWGSDVLGYDDARSTDHGWGPRLQVFVVERDVEPVRQRVDARLPARFRERPTRFGWDDVPVQHHVEVRVLPEWLEERLGFDPRDGVDTVVWLAAPQQLLLEITGGAVFHDDLGELAVVREALAWYPNDVWLWLLACQWRRLDQEEPFVGRTAEVGDDLGSRVITARLARDLIRLCFLLERRYAPYSKWLGSAFRTLEAYESLSPPLLRALEAKDFAEREDALVEAFTAAARRHNATAPTRAVAEDVRLFHTRPFRVLASSRFADACLERVRDERLRSLPLIGGIDQWVDSADVLSAPHAARRTRSLYERSAP